MNKIFKRRQQHDKANYECKNCGHVFPKKEAVVSGWEDHYHGLHVHCPKCCALIEQYL